MAKQPIQGLNYADTAKKGYKRVRRAKKFIYENTRGDVIKDERTLRRIASLVIPPAWKDVWICTDPKGHIQCYGYDDRNRKQYIYHTDWSEQRNLRKFKKINDLGCSMQTLTKRINKDLRSPLWNKEKVCALALSITKETLIRVGNAKYTKENKSYGLTTLKKSHVSFGEKAVHIDYVGKKGVKQVHEITNVRLYRLLHDLHQIPGRTVFRYYPASSKKSLVKLKPKDINSYLESCCDDRKVTVKSFRIWGASVLALHEMILLRESYDKDKASAQLNSILDQVAEMLGNTRAVAKKYYVHPILQDLFLTGKLYKKLDAKKKLTTVTKKQVESLFQQLVF